MDHESRDQDAAGSDAGSAPSAVPNTSTPSIAGTAGQEAAGTEPAAAAPRRRATRSRTTKKVAAALTADDAGQLPFPPAIEAGADTPAIETGTVGVPVGEPVAAEATEAVAESVAPVKRARAPRKRTAPRAAPRTVAQAPDESLPLEPVPGVAAAAVVETPVVEAAPEEVAAETAEASEPAKKTTRRRSRKAVAPVEEPLAAAEGPAEPVGVAEPVAVDTEPATLVAEPAESILATASRSPIMPLFQAPEPVAPRARRSASRPAGPPKAPLDVEALLPEPVETAAVLEQEKSSDTAAEPQLDVEISQDAVQDVVIEIDLDDEDDSDETDDDAQDSAGLNDTPARRRRRRGGRGRRGRGRGDADLAEGDEDADQPESGAQSSPAADGEAVDAEAATGSVEDDEDGEESAGEGSGSRRRRRRRRRGTSTGESEAGVEDAPNVTTRIREVRRDEVTAVRGSTRLEAKKQRRREGREAGRRRTILTEAEFLTRRESVERVMVVREREGRTQIGVLEDNVLVEHYVARKTQTSTVGNVYLGRVQNVLPSMEAAFVDIGKGRNAVLYAGEVNWDAAGLDGQPRRIEHALKAGEAVLVQVTKDPIGHKGARLTSQISMPGRYLVYVPDGSMTGISRKLPDTERSRLKKILREIVPDDAGVIVRTAAEGASDEELEHDVARLRAQWEDISTKITTVQAPAMLYGEPDLAIKVVRDIFNEDFSKLIVSGDDAWDTLQGYISHVAPDLAPRLERWDGDQDVFAAHRIDEQLAKGVERKVYLPSGGSLVIDRTEAMTVIDVNTGKFTGVGGNLEETVTKNNLEAAEEVVHQLRLRDIGGIIVVDFIDMVLESNRDLVLRRLLECLGRDRTRHQVAEVTSLGLVQMTRKRVGQGLLEVFSETCEHCGGRGLILHDEPVERKAPEITMSSGNSSGGNSGGGNSRRGRSHAH